MERNPYSPREDAPRVAISILNWNGWQDTLECLESVRRLDYPNHLTVVVDNGSWDDSAERIKAWAHENLGAGHVLADYTQEIALQGGDPQTEEALESVPSPARLVLIRNEENLGFTGGNNVSITYALCQPEPAQYVFFLNNDGRVRPDCLTRLVEVDRESNAGIVGAVVEDSKGSIRFAGSGSLWSRFFFDLIPSAARMREEDYWGAPVVAGCAMLIRRDALQAVHRQRGSYLSAELFAYGDELDFCYRASREGYNAVVGRRAVACHDSSVRHKKYACEIPFYYMNRNFVLLARRLLPFPIRIAFHTFHLLRCARVIARLLRAGRTECAKAVWSGVIDGYRGVGGKWRLRQS
jgi:hypothetical protein